MTEVVTFQPHTWETWSATYRKRGQIIVFVHWKGLDEWVELKGANSIKTTTISLRSSGLHLYEPDWQGDGPHPEVYLGHLPTILLRAPGVIVRNKQMDTRLLLLDGLHRARALRPFDIVLDCIEPDPSLYKCFCDLRTPWWEEWIGAGQTQTRTPTQ